MDSLSPWPPGLNGRRPNFEPSFIKDVEQLTGLRFTPDGRGDLCTSFGPEDLFHYLYSVLHSPNYRDQYVEYLRIDFPRIPITTNCTVFGDLCRIGADLVALHLTEDDYEAASWVLKGEVSPLEQNAPGFPVAGSNQVEAGYPEHVDESVSHNTGRVHINKEQFFDGVSFGSWGFRVGGYQVCEKWLKDRRQRILSYDDIQHYRRIVAAVTETIRLMEKIDEVIPGWPLE
jgi:hypothetical protein